jgi:hypothetical protein
MQELSEYSQLRLKLIFIIIKQKIVTMETKRGFENFQ